MSDLEAVVVRPRIHSAEKTPLEELVPLKTPISATSIFLVYAIIAVASVFKLIPKG